MLILENNQLIKKEDITIVDRIKMFFNKIFVKRNPTVKLGREKVENFSKNLAKEFEEKLKIDVDTNEEYKFRQLCVEIENNPEKIKEVSDEMLDKIVEHYLKVVELNNNKIQKLMYARD